MEARAVPSQRPREAQGLLGRVAEKGRVGKCTAWVSPPRLPSPVGQVRPGGLATGLGQDPGDPGRRHRSCPRRASAPAKGSSRPGQGLGGLLDSACLLGPARGSRAPLARANRAPRALAEPARRTSLGPRPRPPMARQARCPWQKGAGPGPAGARRGRTGVLGRSGSPDTPTPTPLPHIIGQHRHPGHWARPGRTCACSEGEGARGRLPTGCRPGPGSFRAASSCPAYTWGPPGSREPDAQGYRAGGARPARATVQLPRPGLGQAEPLASRRQGPPGPDLTPLSAPSPGRHSSVFTGIRKAAPLDGGIPPGMPTCPSPATTQGLSLRPSPREKNKPTPRTKTHTKKPQTVNAYRSRPTGAFPSTGPRCGLPGWGAPQSPALHPAGTPPCGLLCGCLGDQKPTASHGGRPSSGPEPIRSYTSSTLGQPEAWGGRAPTRCEAPAARVQGAHPQRGVDKTHQDTSA